MFKLKGVVKLVNDTVQITEKFKKREFVVTDENDTYPQDIMFQAAQDKCDMLEGIMEGDKVEVSFNLRGREWTSPQNDVKYFNTLDAWRIEFTSGNAKNTENNAQKTAPVETPAAVDGAKDDGLPF